MSLPSPHSPFTSVPCLFLPQCPSPHLTLPSPRYHVSSFPNVPPLTSLSLHLGTMSLPSPMSPPPSPQYHVSHLSTISLPSPITIPSPQYHVSPFISVPYLSLPQCPPLTSVPCLSPHLSTMSLPSPQYHVSPLTSVSHIYDGSPPRLYFERDYRES